KLCTVSTTALEAYAAIKKRKGGKSLKSLHRSFNALYLTIQQRGCGGCFLYKRKACSVCFADFTRQRANMTRVPLMEWNPLFVSKPRLLRNCSGQKHQHSIAAKMLRRTSIFQEKLNERNLHQQKILHSAFMSLNWHSLMQLSIDVEKLEHFWHKSVWSVRGIFKTMGRAKKGKITKAASEARCYSLMAHDVTDIQVKEQNIIFIQYIQNTQVQFRF
ncbi:unnamed protein product, partial [Porites lobata]